MFDFKKQMAVGDVGEADFVRLYTDLVPTKSKVLAYDFDLDSGLKVELKTDDYDMARTPNFFIETLSDTVSCKLGGPFRARNDNVDFFVYYYLKNKTFFWFNSDALCVRAETLIASRRFQVKSIKNRRWTTEGYALPRESFEDIVLRKDVFA